MIKAKNYRGMFSVAIVQTEPFSHHLHTIFISLSCSFFLFRFFFYILFKSVWLLRREYGDEDDDDSEFCVCV